MAKQSNDLNKNGKSQNIKAKRTFITRPLANAIILGISIGVIGIIIGLLADKSDDLQKALFTGSIGLIFGGVFTIVVKLLVEDHKKELSLVNDEVRFVNNILNDLKSVYDRVERARIVIAAHRSALTYGKEMRDLIDSQVQLRNVKRALDGKNKVFDEDRSEKLSLYIDGMEAYLKGLTNDFKLIYREASIAQALFEAEKERIIKSENMDNQAILNLENKAWPQIAEALHERGFINKSESKNEDNKDSFPQYYKDYFEAPLDAASWLLRNELRILSGYQSSDFPDNFSEVTNRLKKIN